MLFKKLENRRGNELIVAQRTAELFLSTWNSFLSEADDYPHIFTRVKAVVRANEWLECAYLFEQCKSGQFKLTEEGFSNMPFTQSELGRALGYITAMLEIVRWNRKMEGVEEVEAVD